MAYKSDESCVGGTIKLFVHVCNMKPEQDGAICTQ